MDVLIVGLGAGAVIVGADFQFGKLRAGNTAVLSYMGEMEGLGVTIFEPVEDELHGKISSSRIRDALKSGHPEVAARLLGHFWTVESRVEHGDKRGRTIWRADREYAAPRIFSCRRSASMRCARRSWKRTNPRARTKACKFRCPSMFKMSTPLLETYLFEFSGDLYGKHLAVELVAYLRPRQNLRSRRAQSADRRRRAGRAGGAWKRLLQHAVIPAGRE